MKVFCALTLISALILPLIVTQVSSCRCGVDTDQCCRRLRMRRGTGEEAPYYFGTQNSSCLIKNSKQSKGSAHHRNALPSSHRLIMYNGYVIDYREVDKSRRNGAVFVQPEHDVADNCDLKWENTPAGYSTVSFNCIEQCIANWENNYWDLKTGYNSILRNSHHFANGISKILKDGVDCPDWCKTKSTVNAASGGASP